MKKLLLCLLVLTSLLNAKNTISKTAYKQLQEAQKLSESKLYKKALLILEPIIKTSENKLERLYAYQAKANIYINKNEYEKVALIYINIINLEVSQKKDLDTLKKNLSQIYLGESLYKKSLKYSFEILDSKYVKKESVIKNIALAYYYDEKYKKSAPYIKSVIKAEKKKESWYRMLYSSYIQTKDYNLAIGVLEYMTLHYTNKSSYWMQLISLYQRTKQDKKSLATLELAYNKKYISQKENAKYFVNVLLQNDLFHKGSLVLKDATKKGFITKDKKNFDLLIAAYLNAKNYKSAIKELNASKWAHTSKYRLMLANIYYNKENYKTAIKVLKHYKFKKGSRKDGERYSLIALCFHELDDKKSSKTYLQKAASNKYQKKRATYLAKSLGIKI